MLHYTTTTKPHTIEHARYIVRVTPDMLEWLDQNDFAGPSWVRARTAEGVWITLNFPDAIAAAADEEDDVYITFSEHIFQKRDGLLISEKRMWILPETMARKEMIAQKADWPKVLEIYMQFALVCRPAVSQEDETPACPRPGGRSAALAGEPNEYEAMSTARNENAACANLSRAFKGAQGNADAGE